MSKTNKQWLTRCIVAVLALGAGTVSAQNEFIRNAGQITDNAGNPHPEVLFTGNGNGAGLFISRDKISYLLSGKINNVLQTYRADLRFVNASPNATITAQDPTPGAVNYYLGRQSFVNVGTFHQLTLKNLWNNIDLILTNNGTFSYQFVINKGGKLADIQLAFDGVTAGIGATGITATTPLGDITLPLPMLNPTLLGDGSIVGGIPGVYVESNGAIGIGGGLLGGQGITTIGIGIFRGNVTFNACPSAGGVTNPLYQWTTGYGGVQSDNALDLVTDAAQNMYVVGQSNSNTDFPATVGLNGPGDFNAFALGFNKNGVRQFATVIGGANTDYARSAAVFITNGITSMYVTGGSNSGDFFVTHGGNEQLNNQSNGGYSAFLLDIDATTIPRGQIKFSSYYGRGDGIANASNIYGNSILALTDAGNGTGVGQAGPLTLILGGVVEGSTGPSGAATVTNAFYRNNNQTQFNYIYQGGASDGFMAQFDTDNDGLPIFNSWCSSWGGSGEDGITSLGAHFTSGSTLYIQGYTNAANTLMFHAAHSYPNNTPYLQAYAGGIDVAITRLELGRINWGTYLGGKNDERPFSQADPGLRLPFLGASYGSHTISFDVDNSVYVTGTTYADFPFLFMQPPSKFQSAGLQKPDFANYAYLARFDAHNQMLLSGCIGGFPGITEGMGVSVDQATSNVYVTGYTTAAGFAGVNPFGGSATLPAYYQGKLDNTAADCADGGDGFFFSLDQFGGPVSKTFFGGIGNDMCNAISVNNNIMYFAGGGYNSAYFPYSPSLTPGATNQDRNAAAGLPPLPNGAHISTVDAMVGRLSVDAEHPLILAPQLTGLGLRRGLVSAPAQNTVSITATPNPVQNTLYVNLPAGSAGALLEIYSTLGTKLYGERLPEDNLVKALDMGDFAQGVYLLHYTDNTGAVSTQRVVKE